MTFFILNTDGWLGLSLVAHIGQDICILIECQNQRFSAVTKIQTDINLAKSLKVGD